MKKILFVEPVDQAANDFLTEKGYQVDIAPNNRVDTIKSMIADYDAVLTRSAPFPVEIIESAPKLKVIGRFGIGVDHIDMKAATQRGIFVVNAPLAGIESVAEHTVAMILALAKNITRGDYATRNNDWPFRNRDLSIELKGKVAGIVGLGRIGQLVAKKLYYGFDMRIIGYDPFVKEVPEYIELVTLDSLLGESDFVSLHAPSTPETIHMIDRKAIEKMKRDAYLINIARGSIVKEEDLVSALKENRIAGAAIDVFEKEPPEAGNELLRMTQVILSPHYAALSSGAAKKMGLHAAQGIDEVLSGMNPTWCVNMAQLHKEAGNA